MKKIGPVEAEIMDFKVRTVAENSSRMHYLTMHLGIIFFLGVGILF